MRLSAGRPLGRSRCPLSHVTGLIAIDRGDVHVGGALVVIRRVQGRRRSCSSPTRERMTPHADGAGDVQSLPAGARASRARDLSRLARRRLRRRADADGDHRRGSPRRCPASR